MVTDVKIAKWFTLRDWPSYPQSRDDIESRNWVIYNKLTLPYFCIGIGRVKKLFGDYVTVFQIWCKTQGDVLWKFQGLEKILKRDSN